VIVDEDDGVADDARDGDIELHLGFDDGLDDGAL